MCALAEPTLLSPSLTAELARLNERQRAAATHPEGPLLVVAGPGTGKTQLLAARVAWLLGQLAAAPEEILCLTFTDAAARNLRQRLLRYAGPLAHRVAIHTFHSLGQLIIQENADRLGYHDLEPASDQEAEEVLREVLDQLPAGHLLRRDLGDAYYDLPHLQRLFQTMKREGWPPAKLLAALADHRQGLASDPAYQYKNPPPALRAQGVRPGDKNLAKLTEEQARLDRSAAAVGLFEAYQAGLAARRRFDYDDMLAWASSLLREHPLVRLGYQERFRHLLVDEFQDTNGAQSQLLYLLAGDGPAPNLVVVGDDDQSIFRFQGASVTNMLDFAGRYPLAGIVVLEENYRSSGPVLAVAQRLIAANHERLAGRLPGLVAKHLLPRHPRFAAVAEPPRLLGYATALHEAAAVAAHLTALHQHGPWPAGGVGVLARTHEQLDQLAHLLRAAGVPFRRRRAVNVLAEPLALGLHRALRYLAAALHPTGQLDTDAALFELLHLTVFAVPPADLARLAIGHQYHRRLATGAGRPVQSWRVWADTALVDFDMLAAAPEQPALTAAGRAALGHALGLLDNWVQAAATLPLPALLERVVLSTLLPAALVGATQPAQLLAEARTLLRWGRAEARRVGPAGVGRLLAAWDLLAATREGLPLEAGSPGEAAPLELLTAHGAKGLEWEQVWVLGCQQTAWRRKAADRGFRLPPALVAPPGDEADREEARRLFFVALTRAQAQLTICWVTHDEAGKELVPCEFVAELHQQGLPMTTAAPPAEALAAARRAELAPPPPPPPLPDAALLDELLTDFALSATVLNAYLACPLACYYEHLLRVPAPRHEKLLFGAAVHRALEQFFQRAQLSTATGFGSADELAELFRQQFTRARFEVLGLTFQRLFYAGPELLRAWWAQAQATASPAAVVEYRVQAVLPGGLPLVGMLDRLDPHPDGYHADIVDYKTGNPAAATDQLRPALPGAAVAPLAAWRADPALRGGDYWRQGVFYHLLLTHDPEQAYAAASVSFDFLRPVPVAGQPPRFVRRPVAVTPAAEATVLAQIRAVDAAIRQHEFGPGCGKCRWCRLQASQAA